MATPVFIWNPSWGTSEQSEPRVRIAELGERNSYGSDGLNADLKQWPMVFENIDSAKMSAIDTFLTARGSVESFQFTNPRALAKLYVCEQWDTVAVAEDFWTITATFREVPE
jgi:phage-related protein